MIECDCTFLMDFCVCVWNLFVFNKNKYDPQYLFSFNPVTAILDLNKDSYFLQEFASLLYRIKKVNFFSVVSETFILNEIKNSLYSRHNRVDNSVIYYSIS